MKRAAIVGAGFSRAIASLMPITDQLGQQTLERLHRSGVDLSARPFSGDGFEAWLSRLAEPQPDLTTAENLRNQALFFQVSGTMCDVILTSQMGVIHSALPWWLQRLVGCYHHSNTTAATFNYDQLLEYALEAADLRDTKNRPVRYDDALLFGPQPVAERTGGLAYGSAQAETFQILKLHGSVDSFWVPGDTSGASIARWDSKARWGDAFIPGPKKRQQLLPGRETFVIPPAAAKSSFYANPVSRELWQQTSKALAEATHVDLVGYSVPLTDLVTAGMLGDRLRDSDAVVTVVNLDPGPVIDALSRLGIDKNRITSIGGTDACAHYALMLEESFEPRWDYPEPYVDFNAKLGVGRSSLIVEAAVYGIKGAGPDGIVELKVSEMDARSAEDVAVTLDQFIKAADGHEHPRARLTWPDGSHSYVAQTEPADEMSNHNGWLTLQPTALPRKDAGR